MRRSALAVRLLASFALTAALPFACGPTHPEPPPDAGTPPAQHADAGEDAGALPQADAGEPLTGPTKLSETGLYADFASRTLAPGVFAYAPRFELCSDGLDKGRYLLLPPGTTIDTSDMDNWVFPIGTKAWKEFSSDGGAVETRLLWKVREGRGGWFEIAYVWNADQTEAFAAPEGAIDANGTDHDVPSQETCRKCHDGVGDTLIGISALQLSRPSEDGGLSGWADAGLLSTAPAREFEVPGTGTVHDALGYLHANCAHCHRPGNALAEKRKLELDVSVLDAQPQDTGAYKTTFDVKAYHTYEDTTAIVVPGDPDASQLWRRSGVRDTSPGDGADGYQMPPVGTEKVDDGGVELLRDWIQQL